MKKSFLVLLAFTFSSSVFGVFLDSNFEEDTTEYDSVVSANYSLGIDVPGRLNPGPGKWGASEFGTGASVTWSYMNSGLIADVDSNTSVALSSFLPVGFEAEIQRAFDAWSQYVDIEFIMATDPDVDWRDSGADAVDIRIAGVDMDGEFGVLANAYFPPSNGGAAAGDIRFDVNENWKIGFGGSGFDIYQVMTHEIGHSIGMAHSETMDSIMYEFYKEDITGLQWDDVMGARAIYGARTGTNNQIPNDYSSVLMLIFGLLPVFSFKFYLVGRNYLCQKKKRNSKVSPQNVSLAGVVST